LGNLTNGFDFVIFTASKLAYFWLKII